MWGYNHYLKETDYFDEHTALVQVAVLFTPAVMVSCIGFAFLAVTRDGALWIWCNARSSEDMDTSLRVLGDKASFGGSRAVSVAPGYSNSLVLT